MNQSDDNPTPPGQEPKEGHPPKEGELTTETVKGDKGDNPTPPGQEPGSKGTTSTEK